MPTNPWMRLLGKLVLDPRDLYVLGQERICRALYSEAIGSTACAVSPDLVEVTYRIREPYRPSQPLLYATLGTLRVYPRLIGADCARVDGDLDERCGAFRIHLPPGRSLVARARRAFWDPAQLTGVSPETLCAAMFIGLYESVPTAPAHAIGQRLAAQRTADGLAGEVAAVMAEYFCCKLTRLWLRGAEGDFALAGSDSGKRECAAGWPCAQRSLVFAGEEVGRLEVALQHTEDSPLFEALLPWVAMAVENCRRTSALQSGKSDGPAQLDPERLEAQARTWELTRRETEVLGMLARGLANKEIAAALDNSVKTCEAHVSSVLRKAGADSRAVLIARVWAGR